MTAYLYEFMFRGRHPSEAPMVSDYHVRLGDQVTTTFGQSQLVQSDPMTPAQAKELGFDLPTIISAINTALMADNSTLTAAVAAHEATIAEKTAAIETKDAERAALAAQVESLTAAVREKDAALATAKQDATA